MRRTFIYPHRSVRALPVSKLRGLFAVLTAAVLTGSIAVLIDPLLRLHNRICVALLELSGIHVEGVSTAQLFTHLNSAPVPVVAVKNIAAYPLELWAFVTGTVLVLLELHRRIPFARSFLVFLAILLATAVGVLTLYPASQIDSIGFASMWLRGEFLVWLVLPWFSASLLVLIQPTALFGALCTVLTQAYGLVWSAVRLALGIGLMHYSGILFVPLFWFALGLLADVIYLMVFYSVALQWAAKRAWGNRMP